MYFEQDGFVYRDTVRNKVGSFQDIIEEWSSDRDKIVSMEKEICDNQEVIRQLQSQIKVLATPFESMPEKGVPVKKGIVEKFVASGALIVYVGWCQNDESARKICGVLNGFVDEVNDLRATVRAIGHSVFANAE